MPNRIERQRVHRAAARVGYHMMRTPVRHPDDPDYEIYYLVPQGVKRQTVMSLRCNGLRGVERALRETAQVPGLKAP